MACNPRNAVLPDCAVCAEGYTKGLSYSCHECSGDHKRLAVGLAIFVGLVTLAAAALLFARLGGVARVREGEYMEAAPPSWRWKFCSCNGFVFDILPLTSIKIVVTVWQIISQVMHSFGLQTPYVLSQLYRLTRRGAHPLVSRLGSIDMEASFH